MFRFASGLIWRYYQVGATSMEPWNGPNLATYKLSPSDFRYLWNDCKYCFCQKTKYGIQLPSIGMPGVFSKMNGILQTTIQGMNLKDVNPELPSGIVEVKEGFLRSRLIAGTRCYLSGRFDIISRLDDGTYAVIDFKITDGNEDKAEKFTNQLHAYKFALENPDNNGDARKVSKMGLITISPETLVFEKGKVVFTSAPRWYEIKEDMESFFKFITEIYRTLNDPAIVPSDNCNWCKYRSRYGLTAPVVNQGVSF